MALKHKRFPSFSGIDLVSESTDSSDQSLRRAENLVLRPKGALTRFPPYSRLWGMSSMDSYATQLGVTSADKTCLIEVTRNAGTFIVAYDFATKQSLGIACAKQILNAADLTDVSTTPQLRLLEKGLKSSQRWFFYSLYDSLLMGNGFDENRVYQPSRPNMPLRLMGSNRRPATPSVSPVNQTGVATNQQATLRIDSPVFASILVFTADEANFPGTSGHSIAISISQTDTNEPMRVRRSGAGSANDPFFYNIISGIGLTDSLFRKINDFVKTDPDAASVLTCEIIEKDIKWILLNRTWNDSSEWYDGELWKD